jgi:Uma2 family endonuclease
VIRGAPFVYSSTDRATPADHSMSTIEDLYASPPEGKAELLDGKVVPLPQSGDLPNRAAGAIYIRLREYEREFPGGEGRAYTDNAGFRVQLPHRGSFSPDAAFYVGPRAQARFLEGAPRLAVEVRSENDYGAAAEDTISAKRGEYFAAGTLIVWDVDVLGDELIRVYRATEPGQPSIYRRGEIAEAEPALPGFRFAVDQLFDLMLWAPRLDFSRPSARITRPVTPSNQS